MRRKERIVVVTVFTLLSLLTTGGTAGTISLPTRQHEISQTGWERLTLTLRVRHKEADVEGRGVLVDSLLEERDGSIGVEHGESILLRSVEVPVVSDGLESSIQVVDIILTGQSTGWTDIPEDRCHQGPARP